MFGRKQRYPAYTPVNTIGDKPESAGDDEILPESQQAESEPEQLDKKSEVGGSKGDIKQMEEMLVKDSDLTASVSRNTVFKGNINSQDNIEIFGEVEGDVTTTAVVKIYGKVNGNVTCGIMVGNNAHVEGNIVSEKSVVLGNSTSVHGNINAGAVTISGQVEGNITATESVCVNSDGAVHGDIETPEMEVCKGAIVFGSVVMKHEEASAAAPEKVNQAAPKQQAKAAVEQQRESQDNQPASNPPLDQSSAKPDAPQASTASANAVENKAARASAQHSSDAKASKGAADAFKIENEPAVSRR